MSNAIVHPTEFEFFVSALKSTRRNNLMPVVESDNAAPNPACSSQFAVRDKRSVADHGAAETTSAMCISGDTDELHAVIHERQHILDGEYRADYHRPQKWDKPARARLRPRSVSLPPPQHQSR